MKANEAVSCRDSMFEHTAIRLSCGSPRNDSPSRYALITAAGVPMPDSLTLDCNGDPALTLFLGVLAALDAMGHRLRASPRVTFVDAVDGAGKALDALHIREVLSV